MKRLKRLLPPIPTKVMYLWEKAQHRIRRIELFTQADVEKKPEIPRDTDKLPEIPPAGGWAKKAHEKHLKEKNNHHGQGH